MAKKFSDFLKGEIASSVFYILFGLCLAVIPAQTINIICKVVFGLVMVGVGIYHIYNYAREKVNTTILDLFTGVIVLVLGGFLFFTPQIIIKLLPYLLGAFILVDNIWTIKGAWRLKKLGNTHWKPLAIGSLVFVALGIFIIAYPFAKITYTAVFAGCVMLADGISDIVFLILLRKGIKKGVIPNVETPTDVTAAVTEPLAEEDRVIDEPAAEAAPEVDEGESEDAVQDEVVINGRWKQMAEDKEEPVSPDYEIGAIQEEEQTEDTFATETAEEPSKEEAETAEALQEGPQEESQEEPQEEVLEEWKD